MSVFVPIVCATESITSYVHPYVDSNVICSLPRLVGAMEGETVITLSASGVYD